MTASIALFHLAGRSTCIAARSVSLDKRGLNQRAGELLTEIGSRHLLPLEVDHIVDDPSTTLPVIGRRYSLAFRELVSEIFAPGLEQVRREHLAHGLLVNHAPELA